MKHLDKLADDLAVYMMNFFLDELGITYTQESKAGDERYFGFIFMEGEAELYKWNTWADSKAQALKESFLQLFGVCLISKWPDNFRFKEDK